MSKFFINRPIVAMVIAILMVIVGLVAMSGLPTAQFPNIERFLAQDVFGSWDTIMSTYFADGGVLDQISRP